MQDTAEVTRRLWSLCGILRNEGVSYQSYLSELTQLLFLKLADNLGVGKQSDTSKQWMSLIRADSDQMLSRYVQVLDELGEARNSTIRDVFRGATTEISSPASFVRLVREIDSIDWGAIDLASFGNLYEGLIEKGAQESRNGAGQYFTPRSVVDAIVKVVRPEGGERVYDPAAGTAGFLVSAGVVGKGVSPSSPPILVGRELVASVRRLGLMNLLAHSLEAQLSIGDSLSAEFQTPSSYDVCLTNPPFGARGSYAPERVTNVRFPTNNKQLAFLQHVVATLKVGGRAAVVVPDNVLFESGTASAIRQWLLSVARVHTILLLPPGIFYATGIKTSVVFFELGDPTVETWYYDLRAANGSFGKKRQLGEHDLADFNECYGDDPAGRARRQQTERFVKRTISEIEENDYSLLFPSLTQTDAEDESIQLLLLRIADHMETARASMSTVNDLLISSDAASEDEE